MTALGLDDEEESEDTVLDNVGQAFFELMGDMPYVSTLTGGRIPISAALPIKELYSGKDQYGNDLSILGYGCMRFPRNHGKIDLEKSYVNIQDQRGGRGAGFYEEKEEVKKKLETLREAFT